MSGENNAQFLAKSVGLHGHWGLSSTFDFVEALDKLWKEKDEASRPTGPLRVLLVHPSDIRHIICTLCRLHRYGKKGALGPPEVHFYLLENPSEVLCRDILLLELLLDFKVPIRQRANQFLEVYGNMKVQRRTSVYIEELAIQIRKFMAETIDESPAHILNFSMLNYRQRDELEEGFKLYERKVSIGMDEYYDRRKRGWYEDRYDARVALQDWDYHHSIRSKASIVHIKLYKEWRETGVAYQFGDQTYSDTNKTLISYTEGTMNAGKDKGLKKNVCGFWGDIVCSPYYAFGIDCETPNKFSEGLFEIYNKNTGTEQHRHHAVEVALFNLLSLLYELEHARLYTMTKANDIYSGLGDDFRIPKEVSSQQEEKEEGEATSGKAAPSSSLDPIPEHEEDGQAALEEEEKEKEEGGEAKQAPVASSLATGKGLTHGDEAMVAAGVLGVDDQEIQCLANALLRADNITACLSKVKVFPMMGSAKDLLDKSKLSGLFDAVFVSCRSAEIVGYPGFDQLFRPPTGPDGERNGLLAVESAKFLVPFTQTSQQLVATKVKDMAKAAQWKCLSDPPVHRRRRDENDLEDDVLFFCPC